MSGSQKELPEKETSRQESDQEMEMEVDYPDQEIGEKRLREADQEIGNHNQQDINPRPVKRHRKQGPDNQGKQRTTKHQPRSFLEILMPKKPTPQNQETDPRPQEMSYTPVREKIRRLENPNTKTPKSAKRKRSLGGVDRQSPPYKLRNRQG